MDKKLIETLLSQKDIREKFFMEIKGYWVFEINKFIEFIQDKNFLSDSYTKFKNKIGLNIDGKFLNERNEVSLVWPFKDCILEGGMTKEDQKRNEIFFNEILAQDEIDRLFDAKVLTNFKRVTAKGEEKIKDFKRDKDGKIRENLIMKGNNLLALHSLKKEFQGKVKLIYIDPPYNTGVDSFRYNDNFNHSAWLTFMKNRLEVARQLLTAQGVIFVQCDDNEQAYLKVLCDEIFDRSNFIATLPWRGRGGRQDVEHISDIHEFILLYAKERSSFEAGADIKIDENYNKFDSKKKRKYKTQLLRKWGSNSRRIDRPNLYFSINAPDGSKVFPMLQDGSEGCWRWGKKKIEDELKEGNIEFIKQDKDWIPYQKIYEPKEGEFRTKKFTTWLDNFGSTAGGSKELKALMGKKIFDYPKPTSLIKHLLKIGNLEDDDIVLDFFAGSGTTGQSVIEFFQDEGISVTFILCEQMDYVNEVTIKRIQKIISNGNFIYCELMKYNEEAVDKIKSAKTTENLLKIWKEMVEHYFLNYDVDIKRFNDNQEVFCKLPLEKQKKLLIEMLNKNQLYVNLSEIDDDKFKVSKEDKDLNKKFYK